MRQGATITFRLSLSESSTEIDFPLITTPESSRVKEQMPVSDQLELLHLLGPRAGEPLEEAPAPLRSSEQSLVARLQESSVRVGRQDLDVRIGSQVRSLELLSQTVATYPSPLSSTQLGAQHRDVRTLLDRLTQQNFYSIELAVPTRAIVSSTLNMARLNFFRMLSHVAGELDKQGATVDRQDFISIEEGLADAIGLRAAEEILRSIICRTDAQLVVRERAALLILHLWHDFNSQSIREVLPMLFHTWQARRRVSPTMGTLLGASELFSLLAHGCDVRFIDFLNREDCTEEEVAAFQEFLFGLSWEELEELRGEGDSAMVTINQLRNGDDFSADAVALGLFVAGDKAEQFYLFFMKRHVHAMNRALKFLPGPKQTAEQYVLEHLLREQWALFLPEQE